MKTSLNTKKKNSSAKCHIQISNQNTSFVQAPRLWKNNSQEKKTSLHFEVNRQTKRGANFRVNIFYIENVVSKKRIYIYSPLWITNLGKKICNPFITKKPLCSYLTRAKKIIFSFLFILFFSPTEIILLTTNLLCFYIMRIRVARCNVDVYAEKTLHVLLSPLE